MVCSEDSPPPSGRPDSQGWRDKDPADFEEDEVDGIDDGEVRDFVVKD